MNGQLKRTLNLPQLVFYGVGTMVGAGIYSVIGAAAAEAGPRLWLSFVFAGVAAFLTVLSYAELIAMFPDTGAEYNFLKKAFPRRPLFSFMAGYLIALNAAATSATVALAFAGYLNVFVEFPAALAALALLSACTALNVAGITESTWVSIGLICIEVAGLVLLIWSGVESGAMWTAFEGGSGEGGDGGSIAGIFTATALIFFIFIGFEDVANLSEETRDPVKTVPRALVASVLFTSLLYVLVALAFVALTGSDADPGASDSPLSDAAATIAPWRGQALAAAALFATASTALISLISISRMLFAMARGGDMPKPLSRTLPRRQTPWVAALVLFAVACLLLPLGEVKTVASVSSFGVLLVFAAVQAAMIALRLREPDRKRPFRVALSVGRVPVLPVVGIGLIAALITQFEPVVYAVGGGAIVAGFGIYFWFRRR